MAFNAPRAELALAAFGMTVRMVNKQHASISRRAMLPATRRRAIGGGLINITATPSSRLDRKPAAQTPGVTLQSEEGYGPASPFTPEDSLTTNENDDGRDRSRRILRVSANLASYSRS